MMVRYSEIHAKRVEMERETDPRNEIAEATEQRMMDEVENLRMADGIEVRQQTSVGTSPFSQLRRSERDR